MLRRFLPLKSLKATTELKPDECPFVDGLRGLSVIMVILFHGMFAVHLAFQGSPSIFQQFLQQFPFWLQFLFGLDKAVDIFFMISAYLLGTSLARQAGNGNLHTGRFYIQRIGRIYPLFLVALLLYGLATPAYFAKVFWQNLLFIDNYFYTTIIPVGWSLSVEMQCYLILPFIILLIHHSGKPITGILLIIAATWYVRWWLTEWQPEVVTTPFIDYLNGDSDPAGYMRLMYESTPGRAGSFMIGLLWAYAEPLVKQVRSPKAYILPLFIVCASLVLMSFYFPVYMETSPYYIDFNPLLNQWLVVSHRYIFCFGLLGMILLIRMQPDHGVTAAVRRCFSIKFWRPFSRLAFPAYLFHFPFIALAWIIVLGTTDLAAAGIPQLWQLFVAVTLASFMVLWFSLPLHYKIELPGIRAGKKLAQNLLPVKQRTDG